MTRYAVGMETPLPYPPPWMDAKTLAQHLSVKPSTIRTLMKHGGLPRPKIVGRIALWNWEVVNRWLLRTTVDETPELPEVREAITGEQIRESVRRERSTP